jgi:uncharacterized protein YxeA
MTQQFAVYNNHHARERITISATHYSHRIQFLKISVKQTLVDMYTSVDIFREIFFSLFPLNLLI